MKCSGMIIPQALELRQVSYLLAPFRSLNFQDPSSMKPALSVFLPPIPFQLVLSNSYPSEPV